MKVFAMTMHYRDQHGQTVRWQGRVTTKPGENVFITARRNRAKKGSRVVRMVRAEMVAA